MISRIEYCSGALIRIGVDKKVRIGAGEARTDEQNKAIDGISRVSKQHGASLNDHGAE